MKSATQTGTCPMCNHEAKVVGILIAGTPDRFVMAAHKCGKRGHKAPCPGSGREPLPAKIEVLSADVVRRLVPRTDYVRLHGFGQAIFSVRGHGVSLKRAVGETEQTRHEWLDVYGPLDKFGHEMRKAKFRSVEFSDVKAKVRNPPLKEQTK